MTSNYKISEKIGEGAFSEIETLSEDEMKSCINEILLLQKVNSENVICCFGGFKESNNYYIALEYADAGDLEGLINIKRQNGRLFSERSIWFYFHQICAGLKALHSKRILHRDLKPANIFLTSKGKAKIGDLGLSRIFSLKTKFAKSIVGTEYYLAPERNSQGGYHFKSDIWSLGCILYELCTLRSPFNGEQQNAYALFKRIETCQFPPIPANCYSRQLKYFVSSCLTVKPENRPNAEQAHIAACLLNKKFEALRLQYKKQFGK
uniref:Protein kinase domain-containing protein n=1 Tax=Panagrolaimus sp. ES5 TaxID=591445 RepID=A0AC34FYV6_9BILA